MLAVRRSTLRFFVFGEIKLIGELAGKMQWNQGFDTGNKIPPGALCPGHAIAPVTRVNPNPQGRK